VMLAVYLLLLRALRVSELDVILQPALRVARRVAARVPGLARFAGAPADGAAAVSTMGTDHRGGPASGPDRGSTTLDDHGRANAPALPEGTLLSGRYRL